MTIFGKYNVSYSVKSLVLFTLSKCEVPRRQLCARWAVQVTDLVLVTPEWGDGEFCPLGTEEETVFPPICTKQWGPPPQKETGVLVRRW